MSRQIFRKIVPKKIIFDLLEFICLKMEKYYLIDVNAYKKMLYYDLHIKFANDIIEYYHISKRFYVNREMTYNSFTNIIRQICKINDVHFESQMKYSESKYSIDYLIYFSQEDLSCIQCKDANDDANNDVYGSEDTEKKENDGKDGK
jgi:hypothetical protein